MGFRRILFAVDGGPHMRSAATAVAQLAAAMNAEVPVLHVLDPDEPPRLHAAIDALIGRLRSRGVTAHLESRLVHEQGVAETIVDVAAELHADLIALGSRGLTDLSGLFRGSVSHRVIALSDVPVLVVRNGARGRGRQIRRILLAIAGGEDVSHALDAAVLIARSTGAEVVVLHARYLILGVDGFPFLDPDQWADREVVTVVRKLKKAGVRTVAMSPVALRGVPREIAAAAKRVEVDLVIIGSRRLSDLASLLLGGNEHAVIHETDRPVLVAGRSDADTHASPAARQLTAELPAGGVAPTKVAIRE